MTDFYGTKTEVTVYRGSEVSTVTSISESIRVTDEQQLLAEFLRFMEELKRHPERFDPEFKMHHAKANRDVSGGIVRVTKCWSQPN